MIILHEIPDIAAASVLYAQCFPGEKDALPGYISRDEYICMSAHDGDVIGLLIARKVADEAELIKIATAARCRRRGVACALLERLHKHLRADSVICVHLEVSQHNIAAIALYTRLGYVRTGLRRNYYGQGDDAFIMQRPM